MKRLISALIIQVGFFAFCGNGICQDKVIVIPLGGSKGDATKEDVLYGKTFSNDTEKGVTGSRPPSPVAATGQTTVYRDGDNGTYQSGETAAMRWPANYIHGFGVQDYLTGVFWQPSPDTTTRSWYDAVDYCKNLVTGVFTRDWRLPTVKELQSLIDYGETYPALPADHPFSNVQAISAAYKYWSSTTDSSLTNFAFTQDFALGQIVYGHKTELHYVWCVR